MNKTLITILMLLVVPLASAIYVENTDTNSSFNATLPVSVVVWADAGALTDVNVTLTSDANTVISGSPDQVGNVANGGFGIATFDLQSDVAGSHAVTANVSYVGGDYLHNFTFDVAAAATEPDFELVVENPVNVEINKNFNIVVNVTNNGTATETGIQVSIVLPAGATTSYSGGTFSLTPGQTRSETLIVNSSTTGDKSFTVKADGATQYAEQTLDIMTTDASAPDLELKTLTATNTVENQAATITTNLNNNGIDSELAVVKLYVDNVLADTQNVNINGGTTQEINFTHTFTSEGTKTVNVTVDVVSGETDTTNNNVQTTFSVTKQSSGGSGGSSGSGRRSSGSGGGIITGTITKAVTFDAGETRQVLGTDNAVSFRYKGVEHKVTVLTVRTDSVELKVESETTLMNLSVDETKTAPLDGIEGDDLAVTLNAITFGKADLTFELIQQQIDISDSNIIDDTADNAVGDADDKKPSVIDFAGLRILDLDKKGRGVLIAVIVALSVLLAAAIVLIVLFGTGKIEVDEKKAKAAKRKKMRAKIKKMEEEIEQTKKNIRKVR